MTKWNECATPADQDPRYGPLDTELPLLDYLERLKWWLNRHIDDKPTVALDDLVSGIDEWIDLHSEGMGDKQ